MYEWKSIGNQYGIDIPSLMCNVNENVFFWIHRRHQNNYLYNFENATWQRLPRSTNKDMAQMKDLYFDSMKQRVFGAAAYVDWNLQDQVANYAQIFFEYFDTIKHKWYQHSTLFID